MHVVVLTVARYIWCQTSALAVILTSTIVQILVPEIMKERARESASESERE